MMVWESLDFETWGWEIKELETPTALWMMLAIIAESSEIALVLLLAAAALTVLVVAQHQAAASVAEYPHSVLRSEESISSAATPIHENLPKEKSHKPRKARVVRV